MPEDTSEECEQELIATEGLSDIPAPLKLRKASGSHLEAPAMKQAKPGDDDCTLDTVTKTIKGIKLRIRMRIGNLHFRNAADTQTVQRWRGARRTVP